MRKTSYIARAAALTDRNDRRRRRRMLLRRGCVSRENTRHTSLAFAFPIKVTIFSDS